MYGQVVGSQYNQAFEPLNHLQGLTGQHLDADTFRLRVERSRLAMIEQNPILPGVEDYIRQGKARGMKLAVASSSGHSWVDGHLKHRGLFHYFDAIICKEDVPNIKPYPDLFLAALDVLHVFADQAVIFEDSLHGVEAARRAGIRVVLVPNFVTRQLKISGETLRLNSLADLSLDELLIKL
jgi:putative hydrolase of the HAD superfamily